jgi:hypothetical protein
MGLLHIYDNSDGRIRQTVGARGGGRTTCGVDATPTGLMDALDGLLSSGGRFDRVLFETHGSPGMISFGRFGYNADWFRGSRTRGWTNLTTAGARVYFNGCNVAANASGWDFLDAAAQVFLTPGGGEVFGQTSYGFGNPFNGHVVHLWGNTRRLYVRTDGSVAERFEQ